MEHGEFMIGLEFWCSERQWRCTDVGSRTVVAIRVDAAEMTTSDGKTTVKRTLSRPQAEAIGWFDGPPYGVVEKVFDEDEMEACTLALENG